MDRQTQYFGALVAETDPLKIQQNVMVALGWETQSMLGTAAAVDGFGLVPTTPASLVANLAPGAIYQVANLEATTWSSLPANTGTSIVKQGLMQAVDPITFTPPAGIGYSQCFLVEAQYADLDTNPVLLPYYNAINPSVPFSGPGGSGNSQNTARLGIVAIQVKAGIAVAGTPAIPTPDPGWVGLYVVTLANGAASVTAGNIATYVLAPFIPVKLPGVPSGVQNGQWVYGAASGTNTYAATLFSTAAYSFALTTGMEILVYFANANTTTTSTLNANGTGAKAIVKQGGGAPAAGDVSGFVPLVYDGANWRINGLVASDILAIVQPGVQSGSWLSFAAAGTDTYTGTLVPAITALTNKMQVLGFFGNGNATTTPTLNLNGFGALPIQKQGGGAPAIGDVFRFVPMILNQAGTAWVINGFVASDIVTQGSIIGRSQVFTASATFTPPPGVTQVEVEIISGGGAGGASNNSTAGGGLLGNPGSGGGGAGYCYGRINLTSSGGVPITIGAGGLAAANANGGNGSLSAFGSYCSAGGGVGGTFGSGSIAFGGAGGTATGGLLNLQGGQGGASGTNSATVTNSNLYVIFARGGQAPRGLGSIDLCNTGGSGTGYGNGGSGASGGSGIAGGNGAPGIIIVRW